MTKSDHQFANPNVCQIKRGDTYELIMTPPASFVLFGTGDYIVVDVSKERFGSAREIPAWEGNR